MGCLSPVIDCHLNQSCQILYIEAVCKDTIITGTGMKNFPQQVLDQGTHPSIFPQLFPPNLWQMSHFEHELLKANFLIVVVFLDLGLTLHSTNTNTHVFVQITSVKQWIEQGHGSSSLLTEQSLQSGFSESRCLRAQCNSQGFPPQFYLSQFSKADRDLPHIQLLSALWDANIIDK